MDLHATPLNAAAKSQWIPTTLKWLIRRRAGLFGPRQWPNSSTAASTLTTKSTAASCQAKRYVNINATPHMWLDIQWHLHVCILGQGRMRMLVGGTLRVCTTPSSSAACCASVTIPPLAAVCLARCCMSSRCLPVMPPPPLVRVPPSLS